MITLSVVVNYMQSLYNAYQCQVAHSIESNLAAAITFIAAWNESSTHCNGFGVNRTIVVCDNTV